MESKAYSTGFTFKNMNSLHYETVGLHREVSLKNRYMGMISRLKQLEWTKNGNTDLKANVI